MGEQAIHAKMGEECCRQEEEQVQNPEAGISSESSRGTEGKLCNW